MEDIVDKQNGKADDIDLSTNTVSPQDQSIARHKKVKTFQLYMAFFAQGMCVGIIGPSLLHLKQQVGVTFQQITYVFLARTISYTVGSAVGAPCYDRFDNQLLLSFSMLGTAIGILVPWCSSLPMLIVAFVIWGAPSGFQTLGCNMMCLNFWGKESGPWIQGLHFSYALGATISPLIAAPFLTSYDHPARSDTGTAIDSSQNTTIGINIALDYVTDTPFNLLQSVLSGANETLRPLSQNITYDGTTTDTISVYKSKPLSVGRLWIPYTIISLYCFVVALLYISSFCAGNRKCVIKQNISCNTKIRENAQYQGTIFRCTFLTLMFLFAFFYAGNEAIYGGFLYTFAMQSAHNFTPRTASYLNSAYYGSFALARGAAICVAMFISPAKMLNADLCGMCTASILLVAFASKNLNILWAATILLGVSMASVYPTGLAWAGEYIVITGTATAVYVVGASLSIIALPMLMGYLIESFAAISLMYVVLAMTFGITLTYIIMQVIALRKCSEKAGLFAAGDSDMNGKVTHV
ncbi:sodium-dependent glucose transporter 1A-like [Saccoglossus kowalevskii]|uniref:Sodium-dependent glucose transporter 1-like n=1 Tax=Saccoglossus kowalevskii TaxID=10224 RepID=A0ABM0MH79_SACKO|nr:PREDICTED: sodium-dependent glucose transporter 1-like [Saccoglossus kowalevskii]